METVKNKSEFTNALKRGIKEILVLGPYATDVLYQYNTFLINDKTNITNNIIAGPAVLPGGHLIRTIKSSGLNVYLDNYIIVKYEKDTELLIKNIIS